MSVPAEQMVQAPAADPAAEIAPGVARFPVSEDRTKKLLEEFDLAREFDEVARADYAFCRMYARGDSHWEVSVNILGTYIDILTSFLYARNPNVACKPAASVGEERLKDAKDFADTMEIMVSHAWEISNIKRAAERWVRSSLTVGIGWLKAGWQETYATDPVIGQRMRDIQENLAKISKMKEELALGDTDDLDLRREELEAMLEGLRNDSERLQYRGLFHDFVPAQNMQVSLDVQNIVDCEDASWIAHVNYILLSDAKSKWPEVTEEEWDAAELFYVNKPVKRIDTLKTPAMVPEISASAASPFESAGRQDLNARMGRVDRREKFVQHIEMWRGDENLVYDLIRGVKKAVDCGPPNAPTTRFYPFFPLAQHEVDGERHPQSLVMRSYRLQDEYNRTRTGKAELRRRSKPKMAFDARAHTPQQINRITRGAYAEWIPLKPAVDGATLQQSIFEVPYPKIDAALFDLSEVRAELEMMWGVQEALSGTIQTAKTATEAEIQQAGTNARTGSMRDREEEVLTKLARYDAEILITKCDLTEVVEIAGEGAVWPKIDLNDIDLLLTIELEAGTTGKPDTAAQREAWASLLPIAQGLSEKIALLQQSGPMEQAEALKELLKETFKRAGDDRTDVDRFIAAPGMPVQLIDPVTGAHILAYPAPVAAPAGGGAPMAGEAPMPPAGDPTQPHGDAVAPSELPQQIA